MANLLAPSRTGRRQHCHPSGTSWCPERGRRSDPESRARDWLGAVTATETSTALIASRRFVQSRNGEIWTARAVWLQWPAAAGRGAPKHRAPSTAGIMTMVSRVAATWAATALRGDTTRRLSTDSLHAASVGTSPRTRPTACSVRLRLRGCASVRRASDRLPDAVQDVVIVLHGLPDEDHTHDQHKHHDDDEDR